MKAYFEEYGLIYALAGAIGGIVLRFKKKMSWKAFVGLIVFSSFMGWAFGVSLDHWTELPSNVKYVFCSLIGVFSDEIYTELLQTITKISDVVLKKIERWF